MHDTMLICTHCPKSCGARVPSSIDVSECSHGFGNNEGKLVCDGPPNQDGLPPGSYQQTCGGCTLQFAKGDALRVLSCTHCHAPGGNTIGSSIKVRTSMCSIHIHVVHVHVHNTSDLQVGTCKHISNLEGILTCVDTDVDPELAELQRTEATLRAELRAARAALASKEQRATSSDEL